MFQYGDWRGISKRGDEMFVQSHYNYRGVPLNVIKPWHVYEDGTSLARLPGVSPSLNARVGQPLFRTEKELGGRAIACDTFSKGDVHDALGRPTVDYMYTETIWPGFGLAAHRDAYNVLYGDGSARLFGDPRQKIVWHVSGLNDQNWAGIGYNMTANIYYGNSGYNSRSFGADRYVESRTFKDTSLRIWHDFDVNAGIDVTAP